jgi:glycosyltransferase involved in cell wall biosynthesis
VPVILHTESSMSLGGQELRILMEMEGLEESGFKSVLAARPGSRILDEARSRGLKAYRVDMRGSLDPAAVLGFLRIIRAEAIDIVNTHGSKDGWGAGIAARLLGRKVVRSRHIANPIRGNFFGRIVYGALCDRIVTTSESIKTGMVERGVPAEKIISVPTGVDVKRFHPGVKKGAFRAELGIGADRPLVGMVAVLRGDKGPDVFIRAAEAVSSRLPEAAFALVGDGWMRDVLSEMADTPANKGRFFLTGHRKDIPHALADLDLFVLSARVAEGVPQAVLQAHAMKVPVVASDVGGVNEVAINGSTALCVPPGDHDALAEAIVAMLTDRPRAMALAEGGYALVHERYTLDGMLGEMERIYRALL